MSFSVYFLPGAKKKFDKLPVSVKGRMEEGIKGLKDFPDARGCLKVQGKENTYRLRSGDYRALFILYPDEQAIVVVDIDKRGRIYKRM